jgi:hypothetical protein
MNQTPQAEALAPFLDIIPSYGSHNYYKFALLAGSV